MNISTGEKASASKKSQKEIEQEKKTREIIEQGKKTFTSVLASYMDKRAKILSLEEKLHRLRSEVSQQEEQFEFLKKVDKKILEVGRNVAGVGEGVKKMEGEKPARKRKRETLEKEAKKVRKLMEILETEEVSP